MLAAEDGTFTRFTRTARGATRAEEQLVDAAELSDADPAWSTAREELELLQADGRTWDPELFAATRPDFAPIYCEIAALPEIAPDAVLPGDRPMEHPGKPTLRSFA